MNRGRALWPPPAERKDQNEERLLGALVGIGSHRGESLERPRRGAGDGARWATRNRHGPERGWRNGRRHSRLARGDDVYDAATRLSATRHRSERAPAGRLATRDRHVALERRFQLRGARAG